MLNKYSIRETSGGFLPFLIPLFAGLSAAGALTGGISASVKTANERKAQLRAKNNWKDITKSWRNKLVEVVYL